MGQSSWQRHDDARRSSGATAIESSSRGAGEAIRDQREDGEEVRSRPTVEDQPMGPMERRSSVLSAMEEAANVALRVQARLPLDDIYLAFKDVIPHLSRSGLHRCLQRHGISRLPKADQTKPKRFKAYEIGYFHIDIAELRHEGGKAFLFVAVDRTSKIVFARIYRKATKLVAVKALVKTVPYKIHTVLTDNGVQFVQHDKRAESGFVGHIFGAVCTENGIEHRTTKSYHPWTNGQAERMVRTIKEAIVKSFHYVSIDDLRRHVRDWLLAYNSAKQLKALQFKTLFEAIREMSNAKPDIFIRKPSYDMMGLNTYCLKRFRRIATRYDKTVIPLHGLSHFAAAKFGYPLFVNSTYDPI